MIEKAKLHIISADWELCLESIQKVLIYDKTNIEALRMYIFYLLSRESNIELVEEKITDLMRSFQMNEPKNAELYYKYSKLFARISGRKEEVVRRTMEMVDRACSLQPDNSEYTTELAYQKNLIGDYQGAFSIY
jgi:tetratricopeptide repeat protein 21B